MIRELALALIAVSVLVVIYIFSNNAMDSQSANNEVKTQTQPEPVASATPVPAPKAAESLATHVAQASSTGDVAKGKSTFRKKCMSCHTIDKGGKNRTGPNLWGIVGKTRATAENYRYSKSMKLLGGVWNEVEISSFIAGPRTYVRDTKMTFPGLKNQQDRDNVLAYLKTLTD